MTDFDVEISEVPTADIRAGREIISAVMSETYPEGKWGIGDQLEGVVVEPSAFAYAYIQARMSKQDSANSLAAIQADPTLADDEFVDKLLSNYYTSRQNATVSFGNLLVSVSSAAVLSIGSGARFVAGSYTYQTTQAFRVYRSDQRTEDQANGILVFTERTDGNYEFLLPVQSVDTGSTTVLARGTVVTPSSQIPNLVSAQAAEDFLGGLDASTNADLVSLAADGITPRIFAGYRHIESTFQTQFSGTLVRTIGSDNAVMHRSRDNILGITSGGMADVYVRTTGYVVEETLRVTASLTPENRGARKWRLSYSLPGAYRVERVREAQSVNLLSGIQPQSDQSRWRESIYAQPPTTGLIPRLRDEDAFFSAHQLRVLEFVDDTIDYDELFNGVASDTIIARQYDIDVSTMPSLEALDVFARDEDNADPGMDLLVRAAIPVLVSCNVIVRGVIDETPAKDAIVTAILSLDAGSEVIPASLVYNAIQPYVTGSVSTVYYSASILGKDLTRLLLSKRLELEIPYRPDIGITSETAMFMTRVANITFEVI